MEIKAQCVSMHIVGLPFHAKAMHYNNVTRMEVTENCFDPSNNPPRRDICRGVFK